jgi:hypothetical protein
MRRLAVLFLSIAAIEVGVGFALYLAPAPTQYKPVLISATGRVGDHWIRAGTRTVKPDIIVGGKVGDHWIKAGTRTCLQHADGSRGGCWVPTDELSRQSNLQH